MSRAEASGKLILLGEHVVVHGAPALVAGIGRGLWARIEPAPDGASTLVISGGAPTAADAAADAELGRAFAQLLAEGEARPVRVEVGGDLPAGMGLGFSAAAAVAIARALERLERGDEAAASDDALERVRARAMAWERVFHGNPSGVDVAAAMHGGCLRFRRGEGPKPLAAHPPLRLAVGLTGVRSSTRQMVEGVAKLARTRPALVEKAVAGIGALVDNAAAAVEAGDAGALGELMDMNQMLLAGLMLSTDAIEALCASARAAGALGAKLTGAGGGGAVVAVVGRLDDPDSADRSRRVIAAWRELGFEGFDAPVGRGAGAR
jgi:mevalonate kinase